MLDQLQGSTRRVGVSKLATVDLQVSCGQMAIGHSDSSSDIGCNVLHFPFLFISTSEERAKSVRRACEDCAQMFYNVHKVEMERSLDDR
jgi:hypothetical protein